MHALVRGLAQSGLSELGMGLRALGARSFTATAAAASASKPKAEKEFLVSRRAEQQGEHNAQLIRALLKALPGAGFRFTAGAPSRTSPRAMTATRWTSTREWLRVAGQEKWSRADCKAAAAGRLWHGRRRWCAGTLGPQPVWCRLASQ